MARRRRKSTIGSMTKSRGTWERKPATQVQPNKRAYSRKGFDIKKHI